MARIRTIKPEFFDDEHLCELPFEARLCFIGLWTQADKAGRMEDRPKRLKARIFPFDDVDMDSLLSALHREGFIVRYEVDGRAFLAVKHTSWSKHQRPRQDEPESTLPEPDPGTVTHSYRHSDEPVPSEVLGKERNGEGERKGMDGSPEPHGDSAPSNGHGRAGIVPRLRADDGPVILTFPTVGTGGPEWRLRRVQVEEWQTLFPGLDVLDECRHAFAWVQSNPGHRKTSRGMPAFLVRWFTRSVDRRGGWGNGRPTGEKSKLTGALEKANQW